MQRSHLTTSQHLPDVAACHMASFPSSFSTKLGLAYNIKSLGWFLSGDNRFLFHVIEDDRVIGYCGGFQSKGIGDGSTSGMMQFAMKEAAIGIFKKPWLIFHRDVMRFYPLIFKNVMRKLRGSKNNLMKKTSTTNYTSSVGLVVIGVHPDYRGNGYFELLMNDFEKESIKRKATKMILSVKASNKRAIAAYKKVGWLSSLQTDEVIEMYKPLQA